MKEPKFKFGQWVTVDGKEGQIVQYCAPHSNTWEVDFNGMWIKVPESKIKPLTGKSAKPTHIF